MCTRKLFFLFQEQYLFVYDALLEALKSGNTSLKCHTFAEDYEKLCEKDPKTGKSQLQVQFEVNIQLTKNI